MHICIPDTREVRPPQGNAYLLYNIHIDGLYHCSLRYRQLLQLHQALTKYFNAFNSSNNNNQPHAAATHNKQQQVSLPQFPPKKLLPLSVAQTEERRQQLEKYLQKISQDKAISNSTIFNLFLLEAQRESTRIKPNQVHLDIELVNGQKIKLQIVTHDSADSILTAVCRALNLKDRYHAYFCLCLCGYDVVRDKLIIKRRLSFFESPYITLQMAIQQQEQLQNVLVSTAASNCVNANCSTGNGNNNPNNVNTSISSTNSGGSNGYSSMTSQSSGGSGSNCRCLSCSTRNLQIHQQQQQQQQTNLTDVPSLCSSSGSYNVNNNNGLYNLDNNSNGENYNNIDAGHYNPHHNNNNNNNTINNNSITCNDNNNISCNSNKNNNSHSHQCYYTDNSNNNNNWLTPSSSSSSSSSASAATTSSRSFVTHRILLRKSYWDPIYDTYILNDQQALNLLFIQTVYDMKHSLMFVDRETYHRLETLLATDQKLEYILLARTLKYYNHVHFEPCYSDYPRPRTKVMISIGSRELNMRVLKSPKSIISSAASRNSNNQRHLSSSMAASTSGLAADASAAQTATNSNLALESPPANEPILYCTSSLVPNGYHHLITKSDLIEEEYSFKVPLIRCWRLTSLETLNNNNNNPSSTQTGGSIFGHKSSSSAATTLAGGKRKSLSLFNGVIGSNSNNNSSNNYNNDSNDRSNHQHREANTQHHRLLTSAHQQPPQHPSNNQFGTSSGSNGRSLLAAMANLVDTNTSGSNNHNRNIFDDQFNRCSGDCCNRLDSNASTTSHRSCSRSAPITHIDHTQFIQYELSFEYLIAKDTLKWITISSDQAIFISISLQGVVDELVSKRDGLINAPYDSVIDGARGQSHLLPPLNGGNQATSNTRLLQQQQQQQQQQQYQNNNFTYMYRDGSQRALNIDDCQSIERFVSPLANHLPVHPTTSSTNIARQRQQHLHQLQQQQQQQGQYQQSQSRASSLFSSFKSSASGSSSATVRGLIAVLSNNDLAGSSTSGSNMSSQANPGSLYVPSCCGQPSTFEISSFRKEPSPIINDAFEGVMANDEDL